MLCCYIKLLFGKVMLYFSILIDVMKCSKSSCNI